jgi:hypothetical protein
MILLIIYHPKVPGETLGLVGLFIIKENSENKLKPIPFSRAMAKIILSSRGKDPFLPLLQKGDLREFNSRLPCLHLNTLKLSMLDNVPKIQKNSLKTLISNKLIEMYKEQKKLNPIK